MKTLEAFDQLVELKDDPDKFNELKERILKEGIEKIADENEDRKLKAERFQFRIEGIKRKYKDPIALNNKLNAMLMESLDKLKTCLKSLVDHPVDDMKKVTNSNVINFKHDKKSKN